MISIFVINNFVVYWPTHSGVNQSNERNYSDKLRAMTQLDHQSEIHLNLSVDEFMNKFELTGVPTSASSLINHDLDVVRGFLIFPAASSSIYSACARIKIDFLLFI